MGLTQESSQPIQSKAWRSAVIGCGSIAPMHVQSLADLPECSLVGLADPSEEAAQNMASLWQRCTEMRPAASRPVIFPDIATLLKHVKPDVVHICTPHHTHAELAVQAMRAGCHVLLEKPPGISLDDLARLEEAQAGTGCRLGLCLQNRFNQASLQAWLLLRSGLVGTVRGARGFLTWKRDESYYAQAEWRGKWQTEGGGVMINQAIHTLDLLIWLAGEPVTVSGTISNHSLTSAIEVEDTAEMFMTLPGGARAVFYATNAYSLDAPISLDIHTDLYLIRLEGDRTYLLDHSGQQVNEAICTDLLARALTRLSAEELSSSDHFWLQTIHRNVADALPSSAQPNPEKAYWGQGHNRLIASYYRSLPQGEDNLSDFPINIDQGGKALRALLALYESNRQQMEIRLQKA